MLHILLKCRQVIDFWKRIHRLVLNLFKKDIPIDDQLIVIGIKTDNSEFMLINVLIIYAQYVIYKVYILNNFRSKSFNSHSIWMTFKNDFTFYATRQFKKQRQFVRNLKLYLFKSNNIEFLLSSCFSLSLSPFSFYLFLFSLSLFNKSLCWFSKYGHWNLLYIML